MMGNLIAQLLRGFGYAPLPLLQAVGALFGRLQVVLHSRASIVTRHNVAWCFPAMSYAEQRQLASDSMQASGKMLAETLWVAARTNVDEAIDQVEGFDLSADIAASGHGAIALIPHLGNWEVLHAWIAARLPITVLYRRPRNAQLDELIVELRRRPNSEVVAADRGGVARLIRRLDAGGIVGILPDQSPPRGSGVSVPFFGHPALTITLPARLAQKRQAKVIMATAVRAPGQRFRLRFAEIFPRRDSAAEFMSDVNRAIEQCVRDAPEQYQWEYKRFKREAPGAFRYYR